jgi:hypothetical protein
MRASRLNSRKNYQCDPADKYQTNYAGDKSSAACIAVFDVLENRAG